MNLYATLRRVSILCSLLLTMSAARAQYIALPDSNWGNWLNTHGYSSCLAGNSITGWQLDTTCSNIRSTTSINCNSSYVSDLTGIQYFTSLTQLICGLNQLTSLPSLPNNLTHLDCSSNQLSSLPALPVSLTKIYCSSNQLSSLPALPPILIQIRCENNQLNSLPNLPASLTTIYCGNNQLTSLPTLPSGLTYLDCHTNQLSNLPALPASLTKFFCNDNHLVSIPSLPAGLTHFTCHYNQLNILPTLPASLIFLMCNGNPNLSCLPRIVQNSLSFFFISGTNIQCLSNRFTATSFDINPATLPLCDASSGCDFYYNIAGNTHNDISANCLQDSLNPGAQLSNMKVQLKRNGQVQQQFYTFNSGGYSFKADSLTNYEVSIDTTQLPFSIACPASGSRAVALSVGDSVRKYENFGLQCAGSDFGALSITAGRFRPGFTTLVNITAGNVAQLRYNATCSGSMAGAVTNTLSGSVHYVSPAAGALTPIVSGNTLTYTIADLNTLQAGSLDVILSTDSNAVPGSQVCITTAITPSIPDANAANNTLTHCFTVVNSLDPNIKEVYPTTVRPDQSEWLTYTVHFQNTGNDTAYLVVLRDTLSQNLMPETFQYLASSHRAVIQLFGNAMVFTFPHINLVDSATNPPLSEGWIQYKVKTKPNLSLGTQVDNTAYIYFDNNAAIATNTARSSVPACFDTTVNLAAAICLGSSYDFYGRQLTTAGIYADTFQTSLGCDSIMVLNLVVNSTYRDTIRRSICSNDSIYYSGAWRFNAGVYADSLYTVYGCDSIVSLDLMVYQDYIVSIYTILCPGSVYHFGTRNITTPGVYTDSLHTVNGCDSIVSLDLNFYPRYIDTIHRSICGGDSSYFGGAWRNTTGLYTDSLHTVNNCDSIMVLNLVVNPTYRDTIHRAICEYDSSYFGGAWRYAAGLYTDSLQTVNNCDSIVVLNLSVNPTYRDTIHRSICEYDSSYFGGAWIYAAGLYTDSLHSVHGCDSIVSLDLIVNPLPGVSWPVTSYWDTIICNAIGSKVPFTDFALEGAMPPGGHYSGYQVSNDTFHYIWHRDTVFAITYTYTDSNGCTNSIAQNFRYQPCGGGVHDLNALHAIRLVPNPSQGSFILENKLGGGAEYRIYDMLGKLIAEHPIEGDSQMVSLPDTAAGIYTLVVQQEGSTRAMRLVIER